jgi:hypothetical protein
MVRCHFMDCAPRRIAGSDPAGKQPASDRATGRQHSSHLDFPAQRLRAPSASPSRGGHNGRGGDDVRVHRGPGGLGSLSHARRIPSRKSPAPAQVRTLSARKPPAAARRFGASAAFTAWRRSAKSRPVGEPSEIASIRLRLSPAARGGRFASSQRGRGGPSSSPCQISHGGCSMLATAAPYQWLLHISGSPKDNASPRGSTAAPSPRERQEGGGQGGGGSLTPKAAMFTGSGCAPAAGKAW